MSELNASALLCIDLQYLSVMGNRGLFLSDDVQREDFEYYEKRLNEIVLPNVQRLQEAFRSRGLEVIHARIQSMTSDGRDRSLWHKKLKLHAPPGSKEADFLPEVAPEGDELVFNKTASGVFASTNLLYVLNNISVNKLFVVGVFTNECVESAIRSGCDCGFEMALIDDACAAVSPDLHSASIEMLNERYCEVLQAKQLLSLLT